MTPDSNNPILERERNLYIQALHIASHITAGSSESQCYEILAHWNVEPPTLASHLRFEATKAIADQIWEDIIAFQGSYKPTQQELTRTMESGGTTSGHLNEHRE